MSKKMRFLIPVLLAMMLGIAYAAQVTWTPPSAQMALRLMTVETMTKGG